MTAEDRRLAADDPDSPVTDDLRSTFDVGLEEEAVARILVVEDEWLVSDEIEMALEEADYEVVAVAVSADEAVTLAGIHRPDLVLMDIRLKGERNGFDAALEIKRRFGLRCLFISAHADPAARERGQAADPVGWLPKPFSSQQLVAAVRAAGF